MAVSCCSLLFDIIVNSRHFSTTEKTGYRQFTFVCYVFVILFQSTLDFCFCLFFFVFIELHLTLSFLRCECQTTRPKDNSPLTLTLGNLHMIVLFEQHAPPAFAYFQTLGQIVWGELSLGRVVQIHDVFPINK